MKSKSTLLVALAGACFLAGLFALTSFRIKTADWIPYSRSALAENASNGKPTAVLYFARWTVSADPNGMLNTTSISQSLADSNFALMAADLTDFPVDTLREFKDLGFVAVPVLVLYPTDGPPVGFASGTPETQIVAAIERIARGGG